MINYIRLALAAVVVAMAGGLFWQHQRLQAASERAAQYQGSIASLEASLEASRLSAQLAEKALARQAAARAAERAKLKASNAELNRLIQEHRDWADQPVPPGVADWVREH